MHTVGTTEMKACGGKVRLGVPHGTTSSPEKQEVAQATVHFHKGTATAFV